MSDIATQRVANGWRSTPLKAEVTLKNGKAYNAEDWKKEGYPIIRIQNLKNPLAEFNYFQGDPESEVPIRSGDLVFSWSGSKGTSFGPHIWRGELGVLNQHIFKVVMNPDSQLRQDFLYFALKFLTTAIEDKAYGLAALVHVRKGDLESTQIPLPPLPEQKTIAHILSTVQRAIEAQERIIQTTTELKKALMHQLFTKGLPRNSPSEGGPPIYEPQKQTEIGPVPQSWEVVEIGDLGKCVTGSTPKTKVASFYDPPSKDFIAPADLGARRYVYDSEKKISPEGMATIRPLPMNAVMCVCIGSSIGKVGMSYREESATNQQINSIICGKGHDPEFIYFLLSYRSEYWKSFATFGPVPILSKGRFSSILVPIPPSLEDQQAIAKPLVAMERKIEVAEKKVAALQDLFRALLHELMTAKTRVHKVEFSTQHQGAA